MTEEEKGKKLEDAKLLLDVIETPGGKLLLKLIDDTIATIPADVVDFILPSPSGMTYDVTRASFSAGGKTYLTEVKRRIDEIKDFVKELALQKLENKL